MLVVHRAGAGGQGDLRGAVTGRHPLDLDEVRFQRLARRPVPTAVWAFDLRLTV